MKKLLKTFLTDNDGLETVEYLAALAILISLAAVAIFSVGRNVQAEGLSVGSYIDGINAPSSP